LRNFKENMQKYAEAVLKVGVNLQPNQVLYIQASTEALQFVRLVTKEAYKCSAKNVVVHFTDDEVTLMKYQHATDDTFMECPIWYKIQREDMIEKRAAFLFIESEDPDLLAGVDPKRIANYQKAVGEAMKKWREAVNVELVSWTIIGVPGRAWAEKVFPNQEDSYDKLWDAIFRTTRIYEEDPVAAWESHNQNLHERATYLTKKKYRKLHYRAKGTDLTIELNPLHIWIGGSTRTQGGVAYTANMPTEEIFTSPVWNGVNGYVTSKKPLSYAGTLIDDFKFVFENGRIVEVTAAKGEEVLKNLVATDEGTHYLGEVALVPHESPISNSNLLFLNSLYDENASNHLALGSGFPYALLGGTNMSREELTQNGINQSIEHVDFMIGCADMDIDGILEDGTVEAVFRNGNWAF